MAASVDLTAPTSRDRMASDYVRDRRLHEELTGEARAFQPEDSQKHHCSSQELIAQECKRVRIVMSYPMESTRVQTSLNSDVSPQKLAD